MDDRELIAAVRKALAQATPGPWRVGPHYKSDVESRSGRIAEVMPWGTPRGEANAALIADSPGWLAALCDALERSAERRCDTCRRRRADDTCGLVELADYDDAYFRAGRNYRDCDEFGRTCGVWAPQSAPVSAEEGR